MRLFKLAISVLFLVSCTVKGTDMPKDYGDAVTFREDGAPERKSGWSATGTLTPFDSNKSVSLSAIFEETGTYTVILGATFPNNATNLAPIQAEATVEWSVEGNTVIRKVSVGQGTSIQGAAQAVRVIVKDVSSNAGPAPDYDVTILVVHGSRGVTPLPPVLEPPLNGGSVGINPNGTADIIVPQNCGVRSVNVTVGNISGAVIPDGSIVVQQIVNGGVGRLRLYDPRNTDWVPVAPTVTIIRLRSFLAFPIEANVVFGIEG